MRLGERRDMVNVIMRFKGKTQPDQVFTSTQIWHRLDTFDGMCVKEN